MRTNLLLSVFGTIPILVSLKGTNLPNNDQYPELSEFPPLSPLDLGEDFPVFLYIRDSPPPTDTKQVVETLPNNENQEITSLTSLYQRIGNNLDFNIFNSKHKLYSFGKYTSLFVYFQTCMINLLEAWNDLASEGGTTLVGIVGNRLLTLEEKKERIVEILLENLEDIYPPYIGDDRLPCKKRLEVLTRRPIGVRQLAYRIKRANNNDNMLEFAQKKPKKTFFSVLAQGKSVLTKIFNPRKNFRITKDFIQNKAKQHFTLMVRYILHNIDIAHPDRSCRSILANPAFSFLEGNIVRNDTGGIPTQITDDYIAPYFALLSGEPLDNVKGILKTKEASEKQLPTKRKSPSSSSPLSKHAKTAISSSEE